MTYVGTCYYVSREAAEENYEKEGGGSVDIAIAEERIYVGKKPPTLPGDRLVVIDGRYHIVSH